MKKDIPVAFFLGTIGLVWVALKLLFEREEYYEEDQYGK